MTGEVMMAESNVERFAMQRGTILQLPATRPLEVTSSGGTVSLTLDNDPRDLMLGHGERVLLEISERVLAYALDDALLKFEHCPASQRTGPTAQQRVAPVIVRRLYAHSLGSLVASRSVGEGLRRLGRARRKDGTDFYGSMTARANPALYLLDKAGLEQDRINTLVSASLARAINVVHADMHALRKHPRHIRTPFRVAGVFSDQRTKQPVQEPQRSPFGEPWCNWFAQPDD
jgi:hypothetical protein